MKRKDIEDEILEPGMLVATTGKNSKNPHPIIYRVLKVNYNHSRSTDEGSWEKDHSVAIIKIIYLPKSYLYKKISPIRTVSLSALKILDKPKLNAKYTTLTYSMFS